MAPQQKLHEFCQNASTPQPRVDELLRRLTGHDFYAKSYAAHSSLKRTTGVISEIKGM